MNPETGEVRWENEKVGVELIADGRGFGVAGRGRKDPGPPALACLDPATGKVLWKKDDAETAELMPVTLAVAGLWGCGASVDGGSGTVNEGPDLSTATRLDQSSAPAGASHTSSPATSGGTRT